MNITARQGEIQGIRSEAIVVNLFEGARPGGATRAVDQALGGAVSEAVEGGDFAGKKNQLLLLYTHGRIPARRVLVVGLGKPEAFTLEVARQAAGTAALRLQELGVAEAATILHGTGAGGLEVQPAAQAVAEASVLACYRFDEYRSQVEDSRRLRRLALVEADGAKLAAARRGGRAGQEIGRATCMARDLTNHPGNTVTPAYLARAARRLADRYRLRCRVIGRAGLERLRMGGVLGVARGSSEAPAFIVLEYCGGAQGRPLVFIGKGVTFDSGGISLKPSEKMEEMKFDMSGAAAVLGSLQAIAALRLRRHVVGLVPAVENLPDGRAYKPGDVLRTMSGKTIEIHSTDAEGRLILADALTYARRFRPAAVVDLATLTGACVVALGAHASGLLGNDDDLSARVRQAGEQTGERVWPLPLWEEYREQIKSAVADLKNTGGRSAGAITAASLLAEFAQGYPWVHLDIAGTAWSDQARPYVPKGGVGVGVRLLTQLARDWGGSRTG